MADVNTTLVYTLMISLVVDAGTIYTIPVLALKPNARAVVLVLWYRLGLVQTVKVCARYLI